MVRWMRWIGETGLAIMGAVLAVWALGWPVWGLVAVVVVALSFSSMRFPARSADAASVPSTFILGSASGSTFDGVYVEADRMIDGPAEHASFRNIFFGPRRKH